MCWSVLLSACGVCLCVRKVCEEIWMCESESAYVHLCASVYVCIFNKDGGRVAGRKHHIQRKLNNEIDD